MQSFLTWAFFLTTIYSMSWSYSSKEILVNDYYSSTTEDNYLKIGIETSNEKNSIYLSRSLNKTGILFEILFEKNVQNGEFTCTLLKPLKHESNVTNANNTGVDNTTLLAAEPQSKIQLIKVFLPNITPTLRNEFLIFWDKNHRFLIVTQKEDIFPFLYWRDEEVSKITHYALRSSEASLWKIGKYESDNKGDLSIKELIKLDEFQLLRNETGIRSSPNDKNDTTDCSSLITSDMESIIKASTNFTNSVQRFRSFVNRTMQELVEEMKSVINSTLSITSAQRTIATEKTPVAVTSATMSSAMTTPTPAATIPPTVTTPTQAATTSTATTTTEKEPLHVAEVIRRKHQQKTSEVENTDDTEEYGPDQEFLDYMNENNY